MGAELLITLSAGQSRCAGAFGWPPDDLCLSVVGMKFDGKSTAAAYTPAEELANALTHGIGLALSVAGLAALVTLTGLRSGVWEVTSTAIFGATLVLLYTSSTLYHTLRDERRKRLVRKIDHAAIFLLIAGTYTPFLLVNLRGPWGWSLFGIIWALAIAGVALKFWFTGRARVLSTLLYLAMGWLVVIAFGPMRQTVPAAGLWLLVAGGLSYTLGTVFYLWRRLPYHHAVWHLFVLGGSVCHFFAVFVAVVPRVA